jgi:hypothetical protein
MGSNYTLIKFNHILIEITCIKNIKNTNSCYSGEVGSWMLPKISGISKFPKKNNVVTHFPYLKLHDKTIKWSFPRKGGAFKANTESGLNNACE